MNMLDRIKKLLGHVDSYPGCNSAELRIAVVPNATRLTLTWVYGDRIDTVMGVRRDVLDIEAELSCGVHLALDALESEFNQFMKTRRACATNSPST